MKCPKCEEGILKTQVSLKKGVLNSKKKVIYYCVVCKFKNVKEFKISDEDRKFEEYKRQRILEERYNTR